MFIKRISTMKRQLLVSLLLLAGVLTMAQQPIAKFTKLNHDFGTVYEKDGKVSYLFKFTNTGQKVLLITEVKASCGCTTPKWSKKPIPPGEDGFIKVTYDPKNRPGPFNKTITITNNSQENKIQLTIKGDVIPKKNNKNLEVHQ